MTPKHQAAIGKIGDLDIKLKSFVLQRKLSRNENTTHKMGEKLQIIYLVRDL